MNDRPERGPEIPGFTDAARILGDHDDVSATPRLRLLPNGPARGSFGLPDVRPSVDRYQGGSA